MNTKDIILVMFICILLSTVSIFIVSNNNSLAHIEKTNIDTFTMEEYLLNMKNQNKSDFLNDNMLDAKTSGDIIPKKTKIVLNFAGDCTLGTDTTFTYYNQFTEVFKKENRYDYFFENMKSLFANDDLTIVNLEGPLTNGTNRANKKYSFKGAPEYVNILVSGDIEAVNLANNHTKDYGAKGYEDTIQTLKDHNISYFGYDNYYIFEKEGIKIGFAGLTSTSDKTIENRIDDAINFFNENSCDLKIFTFHWGVEREYKHNSIQQKVGRYAIDHGADLVIGHHSHVIQDIEKYKDKYIVYSLANFCFGGNVNPPDKDTFVFNITFEYEDNNLINMTPKIYPAKVSSVNTRNDYKPTLATGDEYTRILNKINKYSNVEF